MRRVVSLISIFISILALSFVLCLLGDVYPDEWICMGFLDIIFYMLLLFELEYERISLQLSNNSRTDYLRFTFAFYHLLYSVYHKRFYATIQQACDDFSFPAVSDWQ